MLFSNRIKQKQIATIQKIKNFNLLFVWSFTFLFLKRKVYFLFQFQNAITYEINKKE